MTEKTKQSIRTPRATDIKPMLASLSADAFSKEGWIYEPKFDGIRAIAYIKNGEVVLKSRGGLDLNHRFPELVTTLAKNKNMVIDGEIVALDEEGRPSFQLLQARAVRSQSASKAKRIFYYVFDMLSDGTENLLDETLKVRKTHLKKKLVVSKTVQYVDDLHCDGETAFKVCIEKGLEGIVAKRLDAPYQPGRRSPDWMKVKATQSAEFIICGYTKGTGSRENTFGALLLGHYRNKQLHYAGGVGTGFDQELIKLLLKKLKPLVRKTSPFKEAIKDKGQPTWVEPKLVAEIKYAEWTADERLRVPVFLRLREDVSLKETGPLTEIEPPGNKPVAKKSPQKTLSTRKTIKMSKEKTELDEKKSVAQKKVKSATVKRAAVTSGTARSASARSAGTSKDTTTKGTATKSTAVKKPAAAHDLAEAIKTAGEALKIEVDGYQLSFSHLDKALWPGKNGKALTKRDYALYLLDVAPYILPHLLNRPLTLVRCPDGAKGQKFFQKHWEKNLPPFVETFEHFAEHSDENHRFLLCNNRTTLLWLAQIADLELHTSHARIGKTDENKKLTQTYTDSVERIERSTLNYPDYLVLDLDPYIYSGKEAKGEEPALNKKAFAKVCKLAIVLRDMLADMEIESFVKTTGRTGLHIYVPIVRNTDYDSVRAAAASIGKHLMSAYPEDVTMDWAVVKRTGKIFFDHNMNARTKTLASIYSPRLSETGTVSVPVEWDELGDIYPEEFTLKTVPARLAKIGDIWADILDHKSDLKKLGE
jgi:bifunctional non-homologous end joining protein LigD